MFEIETIPFLAAGGPRGEAFAAGLGVAAAVLLIGGPLFLRGQKQKQQFLLAKAAIEKGVTAFPPSPPLWLASMRTGLLALTLGLSLFLVGGAVYRVGARVTMPADMEIAAAPPAERDEGPGPRDDRPGPRDARPNPPRPSPAMEQWHQAMAQKNIGLTAMAGGFVLAMSGIARLIFARVERRNTGV